MNEIDIKSMRPNEIEKFIADIGIPKYRAGQIFKWLHRGVRSFDEMTDLPKELRGVLAEKCYIANAEIIKESRSRLDNTRKFLVKLYDKETVETVLMEYHHGLSACISTQVGCKMGCAFCVTGQCGFVRDLTASEMLAQVTAVQQAVGARISNIVLMGMGEPLDNFDHVLRFLELLSHPDGLGIGARHVSVSTCGLVDKIRELIPMKPQFTLSVSLHAPNDEIRSRTMPINKRWGVGELLEACREYTEAVGRRISFEYALIKGENDSDDCAEELASRLRGMLCHVNLIPVNKSQIGDYVKPDAARINRFREILEQRGINATVRRTLGADIDASCGQLKIRNAEIGMRN